MAACQRLLWRAYQSHGFKPGVVEYQQKTCAKKVQDHFLVEYSTALPGYQNESPKEDTFALCAAHSLEAQTVGIEWWRLQGRHPSAAVWISLCKSVIHQRGIIVQAIKIKTPTRVGVETRLKDNFKSQFLRIMLQHNARGMSPNDWQEVFETALSESVVRSVMET
jgi:hypothetical protein